MENMNSFQLLEYAAWALSLILGLWMLFDMIKTNNAYSEDVLMSSKEGEIDNGGMSAPSSTQGGTR